ncbi:LysR family transcriptional regulator [Burkholderia ubonensis subsp. mesacidophila]|uniref:LysR family transcriptional regulator n=2 Tax=Burkholderia ubonensis TaxID=101571 RepID=A0A2A4FF43_9BURK|nr:LysR family transcriptional regulator [Burkholderia ubonensis subsp. mesacidophila]
MDALLSMRLFVRVADLQSFARAAADLDMSNASASRLIMGLEDRLGTLLLYRTTRSLSLTDAGRLYIEQIRKVIDEIDTVEDAIATLDHEPIGALRIVAPVMFGIHVLAPVIRSFKHRHPNVVPEITIVDRHVDLVSEGFDVGLMVTQRISGANTVTRALTRLKLVVCSTRRYLERHGRPLQPGDLERHACLLYQTDYAGEFVSFDHHATSVAVRPRKTASSNNLGLLRQLALNDMGIAILPAYLVDQDIREHRLVPLLDDYRLPDLEMNIAYPSRRHFPRKARLFVDHVLEHFAA